MRLAHATRLARDAARLAWRAAPAACVAHGAIAVVSGLLPLAAAWLLKLTLDVIAGEPTPAWLGDDPLVPLALALAFLGGAAAVLTHLERFIGAELGRAVSLAAHQRLYAAVARCRGLARMEDPEFHDRLVLAQHSGQSSPADLLAGALHILQGLVTLAGFLVALISLQPALAAVALLASLPGLRAELLLGRRRAETQSRLGHAERRKIFYAGLLTSPEAAKEVRLFDLGTFFRARMLTELGSINRAQRRLDLRDLAAQATLTLLSAGVAAISLVWAAAAARDGALSVGDVSVVIAAVAGVQGATALLVDRLGSVQQALLLYDHFHAIATAPPDLPETPSPRPVPRLAQGIELRDVWFRYGPEHPWVLRGVDLTIPRGTSLALVGENGAGKSTLVKLLCRFYDPTRGHILWDGIDLRDLDIAALRRRIGSVFQDYMEYDLSAHENIALGDLDSLDHPPLTEHAARRAGIHDALSTLPRGYATLLTRTFADATDRDDPTTGVLLSGGQWQRLALARAFVRLGRCLLLLDEPSAGLDPAAEAALASRLAEHRRASTSVLVSHRLSAVRDADLIAVLARGRIIERGTHHDLIARPTRYAHLFSLQARGYRASPPPIPRQALR